MDIPTHCVFRFLFYLFTQLTCIFSQIWTNFLHVMCCFIFLFLHLSFSAIFCSVILHVSNFPSCLHLFFFFSTVCSFSHFLCRGGELLSLYFSSSLCWFTNKLLRLSHCAYFFFLPFFSSSLFSHADFIFLYFFLSLSVQSWW